MRVLIIGASGLVGNNILNIFREKNIETEGTYFTYSLPGLHFYNTLDINDSENFDVRAFRPTHIIHTGALTHVDLCEQNPAESYEQTVRSTGNITAIAKEAGAQIIYVSTDYVFDGSEGPYDERAEPNPLSVYGKHKLEAEKIVSSQDDHLFIRVTGVYGEEARRKNFILRLIDAAMTNEEIEIKLPFDQYSTPVNATDIAKALLLLIQNQKKGTYHLGGTDYVNRVQLANKILGYYKDHRVRIKPVTTSQLGQPAPRPLQGGLKSALFLSEFPMFEFSGIDQFIRKQLTVNSL